MQRMVMVASPQPSRTEQTLRANIDFIRLYMPLWSEDELLALAELSGVDEEQAAQRISILGRTARAVFEVSAVARMQEAVERTTVEAIVTGVGDSVSVSGTKVQISHSMVHFESESPFIDKRNVVASKRMLAYFLSMADESLRKRMTSLALTFESTRYYAGLLGWVFEDVVLSHAREYVPFNVYSRAAHETRVSIVGLFGLSAAGETVQIRELISTRSVDRLRGGDLGVPIMSNTGAWDAVFVPTAKFQLGDADTWPLALQFTRANEHPTNAVYLADLAHHLKVTALRLAFVVPLFRFRSFPPQRLSNFRALGEVKLKQLVVGVTVSAITDDDVRSCRSAAKLF